MSAHSGHTGSGAIFAALGANLGIAVLKFIAYLLTRSSSMLAEAIHSVADSGNQLLLLVGGKVAQKEADEEHPFGYGRNRLAASSRSMKGTKNGMTRTELRNGSGYRLRCL